MSAASRSSPDHILAVVTALSDVSLDTLQSPCQARKVGMVRAAAAHLLRVDGGLRVTQVAPLLGRSGQTVCDFSRNARLDLQNGGAIAALIEQARRVLEAAPRDSPSVPPAAARLPGRRPGPPPTPSALPVPHLGPWRVRTGLSQRQLAQRSSMARETMSRLENGRPARRHVILRLADALALAPSELTGRTELDALTGEAYKKCKGCGALRPLPRFVQVKGARYFYPRCRTCRAECARERYHADAEQRAAQISRAQRNRLKHKLAVA